MPDETIPRERRNLPEPGIALCLSGGGYRAMLFHTGALWRLNEAGYLPKLKRISSVSGGSIAAGYLGLQWGRLAFDAEGVGAAFEREFVAGIRKLARHTIDVRAGLSGIFSFGSIAEKVAKRYSKHLFGDATLQNLPDHRQHPRFVINATNMQSGALWRFSRPYMRDWRVGKVSEPRLSLALAVAASSAFPPFLSPLRLSLDAFQFEAGSGEDLQREPFTSRAVLSDGGVYDNLGLETALKRFSTLLVADGGGRMAPETKPKRDWLRHLIRVLGVIDNQVRSLRKRDLMDLFQARQLLVDAGLLPEHETVRRLSREGAFWGIRTNIEEYKPANHLDCPHEKTLILAEEPTRLSALPEQTQERLINWGYAVSDAALRRYVDDQLPLPEGYPYAGGVG